MKTMRNTILLLVSSAMSLAAEAANYYVSPNGNDANAGTSTTAAWRTMDKVNAFANNFVAGDQVFFERGGTYRGSLAVAKSGTNSQPISYGAYGTGVDPIFSGSNIITGWTAYQGNIWRTNVGAGLSIPFIFVNGARQELARYPNTGWLRNDQGSSTTLYDNALTQGNGYWNGATLVVRSTNWSYDAPTVTSFSGGTLTFPTIYYDLTNLDWGYFLRNKLSELDMAGEWFYDSATGYLYLWAPGSANPNSLTVEAAVRDRGVDVYWSRAYVNVTGIKMKHYRSSCVWLDGASHISVTGCTFEDSFHGIRSVGDYNTYSGNTFSGIFGTASDMQDNYVLLQNNAFTNCCMVPGLGESNWGYMGVRSLGTNVTIRGNRMNTIGYIGITAQNNTLIEKNVVDNATALLNDGGGIGFDRADGAIIQDNIVRNCTGNLDSSAPDWLNYHPIAHGIYFGNVFVKNTYVRRNTVYNCGGSGINVDHAMVNTNNYIQDNLFYNNIRQMSVSDYSNNVGQGAVAPYVVSQFNETYSGNIMYSLAPDQLCMYQYNCYSGTPVDFGTFTNNKYFNPYNEQSIFTYNIPGPVQKWWTVGYWQAARNEDAGSTAHPLKQNLQATASELTGNLVNNGSFDQNVTGWSSWPTNAQVTRVTTNLDNGCLKAYIPNNSVYHEQIMRNPDQFAMTNGQWYRMRFSIQSNANGEVMAGVKGYTQIAGGLATSIYEKRVPFDAGRRDVEFYFQSNLTDNALTQFVNQYTEPMFYLDNVQLHRVTVQQLNAADSNTLLCNDQATAQTMSLPAGCWSDVNGVVVSGTVTVQPYSAKAFYKMSDGQCGQSTTGSVSAKVLLGGALNWTTGIMRDDLHVAGILPASEPYTAMGYTMENTGATVTSAVLAATGNNAVVDWVLVELKNNNAGFTVAARRAAMVRKDGTVITPDGNTVIPFSTTTAAGKLLVIRHRNHLGVMTGAPLTANGIMVDFTLPSTATYGTGAQQVGTSKCALWMGNVNGDNMVKYTGASNDRDPILTSVGGVVPTAYATGYLREDANMDAWSKYTGAGNDRDPILTVVGGTVPTDTRMEQIP